MIEQFYIMIKDNERSRFAHDAGVFEPFKFIGTLMSFEGNFEQPIPAVLQNFIRTGNNEKFSVGIIVPKRGAAILPDHKVLSDGVNWTTVDDICKTYEAQLLEEEAA